MEQFVGYTNQSILYSSTGVFSGSMTGVGPGRYSILWCYWLIPNRNTKDGISINISWVRGSGVNGTKGLECRSNRWIIFDWYFGYCVCYGVAVGGGCWPICVGTGCIGVLVFVGLIPSTVQEGTMIIILCVRRSGGG